MKRVNLAIVGATGMVGRTFLKVLEERKFPINNLYLFSSEKSAGTELTFRGKEYKVEALTEESFDRDIDIALFSAGGDVSKKFAPIARDHGVIVVDNSSAWRMENDVPLVVPEVNPKDVDWNNGIIANPNCSTIQSVVPLTKLHEALKIKRIVYSTYQAVSGSGVGGIKDLENGISFIEGLNKLKNMVNEGDIICSWAKDDIAEIIRNSNYYGYNDLSWINNYLDIQEYVTKILGFRKSLSLKNALKALKIKVNEDSLHDALNDSIYTAHVFKNVYNARAIKRYIIEDIYKMPALEVTSLEGVELNYDKINQICPKCQRKIEIAYPFSIVGWRFISLGTCTKCNSRILDELIVRKSLCGEEIYKEVATVIDEYDYLRYENKLKHKVYN